MTEIPVFGIISPKVTKGFNMAYMTYEEIAKLFLVPKQSIYTLSGGALGNSFLAFCYQSISDAMHNKTSVSPYDFLGDNASTLKTRIDKDPSNAETYKKLLAFVDQVQEITKNPHTPEALSFFNNLKQITQIERGKNIVSDSSISYELRIAEKDFDNASAVFLKQISNVQDEQLKYNMLYFLCRDTANRNVSDVEKAALTMRANSPFATINDLYLLLLANKDDKAMVAKIFQDMENITQKQLTQELSKPVPDAENLKNIVSYLPYVVQYLDNPNAEREILQKYDIKRMMLPDGLEYLQKIINEPAEKVKEQDAQIREMMARIRELEQQNRILTNELDATKQTLQDAQNRNQTLNSENSALRQQNTAIAQQNEGAKKKLLELKSGIEKLGMLGAGQNELKKRASEMEI